jgi:transposase
MAGIMKKTGPKSKTTSGQDLRDLGIIQAAATGKNQSEIADDFGLSRSQVNRILNSEEAKQFNAQARSDLQRLLVKAVQTIDYAMDQRDKKFGLQPALSAAQSVLKGMGVLTDKVKHEGLKPFVMQLMNGDKIIMGHKPDDETEEGEHGEED